MKQELRQVHFYGLSLHDGCPHGMEVTDRHTLMMASAPGGYLTPMFDTKEPGCSYGRLTLDGRFSGVKLEVIAAATDETYAVVEGKRQELAGYLRHPGVPVEEKARILQALPHVRGVNTRDILLYGLTGRYLHILVLPHPTGTFDCELYGLRLELPKCAFTEYFPEIYHGNEFFDRYIAMFQSMFLDLERQVDRVPLLLDYRTTPDENVETLAGWLGIDNSRRLFTPDKLRHLIEHLDLYQGAKGTKRALSAIIELVSGIRPRIVEYFEWARPGQSEERRAVCKTLYGETPGHFCVMLDLARQTISIEENDLARLIESYCPLDARFKVVYLRPCSHTDVHCYLDVNAALSTPEIASIDGGAIGEHITIG